MGGESGAIQLGSYEHWEWDLEKSQSPRSLLTIFAFAQSSSFLIIIISKCQRKVVNRRVDPNLAHFLRVRKIRPMTEPTFGQVGLIRSKVGRVRVCQFLSALAYSFSTI